MPHIRSMYIGTYSHKYKGFYENFIFSKSINRKRITIIRVPMGASWKTLPSSLPLVVMSVLEENQ